MDPSLHQKASRFGQRFHAAKRDDTRNRLLLQFRSLLGHVKGANKAFYEGAGISRAFFFQKLNDLKADNTSLLTQRRNNAKAVAQRVKTIRESLIKQHPGPRASSSRAIAKRLRSDESRSPRTVRRYVKRGLDADDSDWSKAPDRLRSSNAPHYRQYSQ